MAKKVEQTKPVEEDDDEMDPQPNSELDSELDFDDEDVLLEDDEDDDIVPSVLYKGVTKPKTEDEWRQLLLEASKEGVPEYLISGSYAEGDLILHASFGLGVVSKVLTQHKMEVVYDLSNKLMAMGTLPPESSDPA